LPAARRSDSSRSRLSGNNGSRAAIACGMPLPCEPGKNRRARNAEAANALGVIMSARYGEKHTAF
jgi:hypothetical protein